MADIGAGTGIVEGVGNALGMLADRLDSNKIQQAKQRDLMADHLEAQAREIGDNIMKVGGFDAPEAQPLREQLSKVVERHQALFPPHESGKLIQRIQKFIGHKTGQPQEDPRSQMSVEQVLAGARRPEFEKTPAGQMRQAKTNIDITNLTDENQQKLIQQHNEAILKRAQELDLPEETMKQLKAVVAGVPSTLLKPPAEKSGQWKPISGTLKNGDPFTYMHSASTNEVTDVYGRPLDPGFLDGFKESPKSAAKPKQAFLNKDGKFVSVMLDSNNQPIPGTENENVAVPASLTGRMTTGQYHWVDEDGNVHETPYTTSSRPIGQGGGGSATTATPPAAAPSPTPAGTAGASTPAPGAPKPAAAAPKPAVSVPATPKEARDRILGNKGTPALTKAREDYNSAQGLENLANDAWKAPSATKDKNLAIRIIKEAAGRFNMTEFDTLTKKAGLGNSFEALVNSMTTGELPIEIRRQLVNVAKSNAASSKAAFEAAKQPMRQGNAPAATGGKPGNPLGLDLPGF